MSRSVIETVLGGFVLIGALIFLAFSYSKGGAGAVIGYKISANFSKIGGLKSGDPVQISGVKIGQIANVTLDPATYLAKVTMEKPIPGLRAWMHLLLRKKYTRILWLQCRVGFRKQDHRKEKCSGSARKTLA